MVGAIPSGSTPTTHHRLAWVSASDRAKASSRPESSRNVEPSTWADSKSIAASSANWAGSRPVTRLDWRPRERLSDADRRECDRWLERFERRAASSLDPNSTFAAASAVARPGVAAAVCTDAVVGAGVVGSARGLAFAMSVDSQPPASAGMAANGSGLLATSSGSDPRLGVAAVESRLRNGNVGCKRPVGVRGGAASGDWGDDVREESGDSSGMSKSGHTGEVKSKVNHPNRSSPGGEPAIARGAMTEAGG